MTTKTRYFVIASLLVLTVGLGTGLVAFYSGYAPGAANANGADEIRLLPADSTLVAYADVGQIMATPLRQKIRDMLPMKPDGQQEFQNQTGINIETDIDRVVAALVPSRNTAETHSSGIILARGRFDAVKIEALMREHGAHVETYQDQRIVGADAPERGKSMALAFLEPGLVAVGSSALIRTSIDLRTGGASVMTNDDLMARVRELSGGNAWAVGRFDVLTASANLPQDFSARLPAITWLSGTATIDSGVRARIRAEARDEESANGLRDIIRGIVALARLQVGSQPAFQTLVQTLELGGDGKNVTLAFDAPAEIFDTLGALIHPRQPQNQQ